MGEIASIGVVEREAVERVPPKELRDDESVVVVDEEYEEGLYRIEENDHVVVVFHLDRSEGYTLRGDRLYGTERGVFDSRSPNRPGNVGVTTVELLERDGRRLRVRGLDAIDGTPVLDIKPFVPGLDTPPSVDQSALDADPRAGVDADVRRRALESLFVDAAAFHGAYCPLLAAGVLAATYAARDLGDRSTRGLVAGVESDGCLLDAAQYVLGTTPGNGRLQYRDPDALALWVAAPDGASMRIELSDGELRSVLDIERLVQHAGTGEAAAGSAATGSAADGSAADTGTVDTAAVDDRMREAAFDLLERPLSEVAQIERDGDLPDWLPAVE